MANFSLGSLREFQPLSSPHSIRAVVSGSDAQDDLLLGGFRIAQGLLALRNR